MVYGIRQVLGQSINQSIFHPNKGLGYTVG